MSTTTEIKSFQMSREQAEGLLDYYAASALNGLIVKSPFLTERYTSKEEKDAAATTSECVGLQRFLSAGAFGYAKAMMAERVSAMEWLADCHKLHSEGAKKESELNETVKAWVAAAHRDNAPNPAGEAESENHKEEKFQKLLTRLNELSVENKALRNKVTDVTNRWARLNEQNEDLARDNLKAPTDQLQEAIDALFARMPTAKQIAISQVDKAMDQAVRDFGVVGCFDGVYQIDTDILEAKGVQGTVEILCTYLDFLDKCKGPKVEVRFTKESGKTSPSPSRKPKTPYPFKSPGDLQGPLTQTVDSTPPEDTEDAFTVLNQRIRASSARFERERLAREQELANLPPYDGPSDLQTSEFISTNPSYPRYGANGEPYNFGMPIKDNGEPRQKD